MTNKINFTSLTGKMLVANPYCSFGDVFDKCIIYVAAHSDQGSIGLIVNKGAAKLGVKKLYKISDNNIPEIDRTIFIGGPIEPDRSFVLHSSDYSKNLLFKAEGDVFVSSNLEVIRDLLKGKGPEKSVLILGYTGWGSGELEEEIENNYWLIADADRDIIFDEESDIKWQAALEKIGVENNHFSSQMGHS